MENRSKAGNGDIKLKIIQVTSNKTGAYPPSQDWYSQSLPQGYALWPDDLDDADFYAHNGFVTLTVEQVDGVDTVTGYAPDLEAWEAWKAGQPDPALESARQVREQRDALLAACDWTQMPDNPMPEEEKEAWREYRQALRDVPEQEGFPETVTWPDEPVE